MTKEPVCPQCNGHAKPFLSAQDINRASTQQLFDYFKCARCSLVFLHPLPDDMAPYYAGGYQKIPESYAELKAIAQKESYRLDALLQFKSGGKLLEIGPWMGLFSCNAKEAGFEVEAIENDADCVKFLNEVLKIKTYPSNDPAKTLANMSDTYDVIVLWHCLEHLPTPWLVIENAAKRLNPDGVLLIALPNIESVDAKVLGKNWMHLDAPRHLYFYTIQGLTELCRSFGLTPGSISTADPLSARLSKLAWRHRIAHRIPFRYVRAAVGIIAAQIVYFFMRTQQQKEGLGAGITAIFKK